jgi:glycosyl transferase family 25
VDGRTIAQSDWHDFDAPGFARRNGRTPLPGEYGCHASHLLALERIADSDLDAAVVLEDDVAPGHDFAARITALTTWALRQDADVPQVIKLASHRQQGFVAKETLPNGEVLGRCLHGPTGSSAGYLVLRRDAARLRTALSSFTLPYDATLERGWAWGGAVYMLKAPAIALPVMRLDTSVADQSQYRAVKFPQWRRLPTLVHRTTDYVQRIVYALR